MDSVGLEEETWVVAGADLVVLGVAGPVTGELLETADMVVVSQDT